MRKQKLIIEEGFNPYAVIKRLQSADLIIHTIPGEEWVLSMYRHKTLLVDVYVLSGTIAGAKKSSSWECGLLGELLVKLLRTNRKASYRLHNREDEDGVTLLNATRQVYAETLEDDALQRLRGGDILFYLIPGEEWRLTGTWFGHGLISDHINVFHLAESRTIQASDLRMIKGTVLANVLLEFLCQKSEFVEHDTSKVLTFRRNEQ